MSLSELQRLDARATDYRFTLDDVPWDRLGEPGDLVGPTLKRLLATPDLDGARIAAAFASLERDLVTFLRADADASEPDDQPGARSVTLLLEEEVRHAEMFERLSEHFGRFTADSFTAQVVGPAPPDTFQRLAEVDDRDVRRHLFWLHCLFFEELTVWIHDALARDDLPDRCVQPTWLAAHRLHAREETQHVLTDAAHLAASPLDPAARERLSRAFVLYVDEHIDDFFGIPGRTRRLRDLPLFDEILAHRAFRRTRQFAPYLTTLQARRASQVSGPLLCAADDTLPAALERSAASDRGVFFVSRGPESPPPTWTAAGISYAELHARSLRTLGGLQARGLRPGAPVVVVCGHPAAAVEALWACLLGGLVPALVPLPSGGRDSESHRRLLRVAAQLEAPLLTDQQGPVGDAAELGRKVLHLGELSDAAPGAPHRALPDDLALLQYSSGSLGQPRGVRLTHRQILANIRGMSLARGRPGDRFASWLPLSHDMGLIGFHLTPVFLGSDQLLAPPRAWLRSPSGWLRTLADFGATVTGLPASALTALLAEPFDADLSRLHTVLIGAEPIDARILRAVGERLSALGLPSGALCPAYGLAEATLAVTLHVGPMSSLKFERDSLQPGSRVVLASPDEEDSLEVVRVGTPIPGMTVRVGSRPGEVGEIIVSGPAVGDGYQGQSERWAELETGDLGFLWEGGLYVCGRLKETFEMNGQTFHAHDVERVAQEVPGVRAAGLGLGNEADGRGERVLFVVPVGNLKPGPGEPGRQTAALLTLVRRHLRLRLDLEPDRIVIASASELLRTTSGKLRRTALLPAWQERRIADEIALVRRIWSEVLDLPLVEVGADDDFRELGGSSIRALEVHARLEDALDRELGHEVLEGTTPRELARRLGGTRAASSVAVAPELAVSPGSRHRFPRSGFVRVFVDSSRVWRDPPWRSRGQPSEFPVTTPDLERARAGARPRRVLPTGTGERVVLDRVPVSGGRGGREPPTEQRVPVSGGRGGREPPTNNCPLAIVALAVRFPGASDPDQLWEMLREGRSAVRPIDRWDPVSHAGVQRSDRGALFDLPDLYAFDPAAFGLRDEQANAMDPQHRLVLELAAEALQQAPPETERVGVYLACGDVEPRGGERGGERGEHIGPHTLLGSLKNMAAGRIAGTLGLTGPALAVDTACSSSLVAVHLAARAVRGGECDLALAGGVQLLLTSRGFRSFDAAGLLSSTGESRPFDRDAAGLVPGEGGAVVAITTLSRAHRLGHRVLALLRGSAVTNDGGGLSSTAPSPDGQEAAIRAAWEDAGLDPAEAGYLEAHAAGTAIGDAVEATAASRVFGAVQVASVKGNLGHTLATAGVAGLARALLSLEHGWLPPSCGLREPTGRIDWRETGLTPLMEGRAWSGRRLAGVSSFGLGGTNAHVVIEAAGERVGAGGPSGAGGITLPIAQATSMDADSGACRRLQSVLAPLRPRPPRVALVLAGPGGQHPGMARALRDSVPAFAELLDRCAALPVLDGLPDDLLASFDDDRCLDIEHAQRTTFALTWALGRWLLDLGLEPAVVLGHSGGELSAAVLTGVLTLEEGWALAVERGRLMARVPGGLMVVLGPLDAAPAGTWIAARNAPGQVVLAGTREALDNAAVTLGASRVRHLAVTCPAHSPLLEPEASAYFQLLDALPARELSIPLLSTRTGEPLVSSPAHWRDQLLGPVEFEATVRAARGLGATVFVDAGPSSGLAAAVRSTLALTDPDTRAISLLTRTLLNPGSGLEPTIRGLEALTALGALPRLAGLRAAPLQFNRHPCPVVTTVAPQPLPRGIRSAPEPADQALPAADHVVQGVATLPAATLYDLALRLTGAVALERAIVLRPCPAGVIPVLRANELHRNELVADGVTVLRFRPVGTPGGPIQPILGEPPPEDRPRIDLTALRRRCITLGSPRRVRQTLAESGMVLGPRLWALRALLIGEDELLAELILSAGAEVGHLIDPALLDSASQAASALGSRDVTWVGFSVERLVVHAPAHGACLAWLRVRHRAADLVVVDLDLVDEDGMALVTVEGMSARPGAPAGRSLGLPSRGVPSVSAASVATRGGAATHSRAAPDGPASGVRTLIARRLGRDPAGISAHTPFSQLGVDSLAAVELAAQIEVLLDRRLPVTLLFECQDLAALEDRLFG